MASYDPHSIPHGQVPGFESGGRTRERFEGPHHPCLRGAGEAGVMGAGTSVIGAFRTSGDGRFTGGRKER
jgi:hypothetical protein